MPTYDFRCPNGHDFERFYGRISEAPGEVACPVCGETAVRQISGGAGLIFKGSGFYITDYGKDGKKDQRASASNAGGSKPSEPASGEGKGGAGKGGESGGGESASSSGSSSGSGPGTGGTGSSSSGSDSATSKTTATPTPPKPAAGE